MKVFGRYLRTYILLSMHKIIIETLIIIINQIELKQLNTS